MAPLLGPVCVILLQTMHLDSNMLQLDVDFFIAYNSRKLQRRVLRQIASPMQHSITQHNITPQQDTPQQDPIAAHTTARHTPQQDATPPDRLIVFLLYS